MGVFGPSGSGLCRASDVIPDVLVGTLGKSVGVAGAFVAGSELLRRWLWNRARTLVFSTAPSPMLAELLLRQLHATRVASDARTRVRENAEHLRRLLLERGVSLASGNYGPILPLILGDAARSVRAAERLLSEGIVVQAIRPPTVPANTARLRVTVTAAMTDSDIQRLGSALAAALHAEAEGQR